MKLLKSYSVKSKLMIPIITFTCLIYVVSQAYIFYSAFETQKQNLVERVSVLAKGVAYNLQAAILFDDALTAREVLDAFSADEDVLRVKLYTSDGKLFSMYEGKNSSAPVPTERQRKEILDSSFSIGANHIFLLVPIELEGELLAHLRVTVSKDSFQTIYDSAVSSSLVFLVLLAISAMVLYLTVDKYIINPVYKLNQGMRSFIDRQQETIKIEPSSDDEIGDLVTAFNTMLSRLKQRDKQVAFTLDKLEEEKSFANEVVESVKHALIVTDSKGKIVHFNAVTCEVFKCTKSFLQGININDLAMGVGSELFTGDTDSEYQSRQVWVVDAFRQQQLLSISRTKLSKPGQSLYAIRDITEEHTAQRRQKLASDVFENSQDGLMVTDENDVITMVNPSVSRLLGYSQESMLGKTPSETFEWQQFYSLMPTIKQSVDNYGIWQGEIWEKHQLGYKVPMFVKVSRIQSSDTGDKYDYVYILSDLSSVKEMERLEYLAHHDTLTGLANRAELYRVLDKALKEQREVKVGHAILYLDLDGFKSVNDTYGHDAGDEVLKQVAERLLSQVRSKDLVARLSGDEFVIFIDAADTEDTNTLAQRLISLIQQDIIYKGRAMRVGASIGVHLIEDSTQTLDDILKSADTAMYEAKSKGKGRFVVSN